MSIVNYSTADNNSTTSPTSPYLQEVQQLRRDLVLLSGEIGYIFGELASVRDKLINHKGQLLHANNYINQLSVSTTPIFSELASTVN